MATVLKATYKQIEKDEVTFADIKQVLSKLQIDTPHKLVFAKQTKKIQIPGSQELNKLCIIKTGQPIRKYFEFKLSNTKLKSADRLIAKDFIDSLKNWCSENNIKSKGEYVAFKKRPKQFPHAVTIISNYGEEYFTDILGLTKYKDTLEDRIHDKNFIEELKKWCIENNIESVTQYGKSKIRPSHFPSGERIRQIYGNDYFEEAVGIVLRKYSYLSLEDARKVCIENGIFTSTNYPEFYQLYNLSNDIKLPSDPYRYYQSNWTDFIKLSPSQLFIGNNMSNLELFTYKLLYDRGIDFETEKTFYDCRSKKPLPFDFYLEKLNILIELDGTQHTSEDESSLYFSHSTKINDKIKNEYAVKKNIKLIRISRLIDITPVLEKEIGFTNFPKIKDLDWTIDFQTESEIIDSKFSKRLKVKLLLLMAEKGKSNLTNLEIIKITGCHKPTFYEMKNELISVGLINRENEYHFTDVEKLKIIDLYKEGKNISQIIRETKYKNREYLIKFIQESGINHKVNKRPTTDESLIKKQQIYDYYSKGLTNGEISRKMNVSTGFISSSLKEMKIKNGDEQLPVEMLDLATKIKSLFKNGKTWNEIMKETGFSIQHLRLCIKWANITAANIGIAASGAGR